MAHVLELAQVLRVRVQLLLLLRAGPEGLREQRRVHVREGANCHHALVRPNCTKTPRNHARSIPATRALAATASLSSGAPSARAG